MKLHFLRRTDLAVRAVRYLEERGDRVRGTELARAIGTTPAFMPHVISPLVERGLVDSSRGPKGGYRLTTATSEITFLEVIEATEGPFDDGRCVLRGGTCPSGQTCALHEMWSRAREAITAELAEMPLRLTSPGRTT